MGLWHDEVAVENQNWPYRTRMQGSILMKGRFSGFGRKVLVSAPASPLAILAGHILETNTKRANGRAGREKDKADI